MAPPTPPPTCEQPCGITEIVLSENLKKHLRAQDSKQNVDLTPEECESDWMEKMKCIDTAHSVAYGLDRDGIDALFTRVEEKINNYYTCPCVTSSIKMCLKYNGDCPLNCSKEFNDFINCVDALRYNILTKRQQQFEKCKMELLKEERKKLRAAKKK